MTTSKVIKYINDYNKKSYRSYIIKLRFDRDGELISWLDSKKSKNGYIADLIREDIKKEKEGKESE